jgi:DNA polymerase-3 subunit delta'
LAFAYARAVLCEQRTGCGECGACKLVDAGSHTDFVHLYPGIKVDKNDKGEQISIKAVRAFVLPRASFVPATGSRVAVVFENTGRLTAEAADAFLKTLEEPPDWMRFVLTATAIDELPPTVVSRCTHLALGLVPTEELIAGLEREYGVAPDEAADLATRAGGLPGVAVRLLRDSKVRDRSDKMLEYLEHLAAAGPLEALAMGERLRDLASEFRGAEEDEEADRSARQAQAECLQQLALWFRDAMDFAERGEHAAPQLPFAAGPAKVVSQRAPAGHFRRCAELALAARTAILGNATARLQTDTVLAHFLMGLRDKAA